jgi:hypothetical protein
MTVSTKSIALEVVEIVMGSSVVEVAVERMEVTVVAVVSGAVMVVTEAVAVVHLEGEELLVHADQTNRKGPKSDLVGKSTCSRPFLLAISLATLSLMA